MNRKRFEYVAVNSKERVSARGWGSVVGVGVGALCFRTLQLSTMRNWFGGLCLPNTTMLNVIMITSFIKKGQSG